MAARFASFTVFFCLLCFSTLSTAVDLSAIDKTNYDLSHESNKKSDEADTILLPTERLESDESAPVIESHPGISGSEIDKPESEVETLNPTESSQTSDSVPITMISFRPLNRFMPWRPMQFPSRHRCHHNHKPRPWNPRISRHQIPYGDDMILSTGDEKSFHVLPDDRVPKIPMRWTKFGRFDTRFTDETGMGRSEEVMMRPHHHHHHDRDDQDHEHDHHHHDDHDHEHERDDNHDHKRAHHHDHDDHDHEHDHHHDHHNYSFYERDHEDGGLMRSVRKFLQHF